MSLPGFYNDNAARSYPLVPFSNVLLYTASPAIPPPDALVDFGCLVGLDAEFDSNNSKHVVYLHEIRRVGTEFQFDFRSKAPGLEGYALVFHRDLTDVEYATDYAKAIPLSDSPEPLEPLWEGFLVTGSLETLATLIPANGTETLTTKPQVEPALIQNLGRSYLRTISLANQDRTRWVPPVNCQGGEDFTADLSYIVNARGLTGDLRFKEGYNVAIWQNARDNSLTFLSLQGAGAGVTCEEVLLHPDELPPDGSTLLTGGPACDEVINSINGLTSNVIHLVADLGTSIYPSSLYANTLVVDFDRHNMTVCGPIETVVEPPPNGGNGDGGGGEDEDKPPPTSSLDCTPLPYIQNFSAGFPPAWYTAFGSFAIEEEFGPISGKRLASTDLTQPNIAVWNCYRTGNTQMETRAEFKIMSGTEANGGLVWQYMAKIADQGLKHTTCLGYEAYTIWLVNVVTNSVEQWSFCAGGPDARLRLEKRWPAGSGVDRIVVDQWYSLYIRIGKWKTYYPTENPWKLRGELVATAGNTTFTPVRFGFNYADVPTFLPPNFIYTSGVWGLGSFKAHCRFAGLSVKDSSYDTPRPPW